MGPGPEGSNQLRFSEGKKQNDCRNLLLYLTTIHVFEFSEANAQRPGCGAGHEHVPTEPTFQTLCITYEQ